MQAMIKEKNSKPRSHTELRRGDLQRATYTRPLATSRPIPEAATEGDLQGLPGSTAKPTRVTAEVGLVDVI